MAVPCSSMRAPLRMSSLISPLLGESTFRPWSVCRSNGRPWTSLHQAALPRPVPPDSTGPRCHWVPYAADADSKNLSSTTTSRSPTLSFSSLYPKKSASSCFRARSSCFFKAGVNIPSLPTTQTPSGHNNASTTSTLTFHCRPASTLPSADVP